MSKTLKRFFLHILAVGILLLVCYSCANEGVPSGGPKDEDPPVFIKSSPAPNSLNFEGKAVKVYFDENVILKDVFSNFIASPPLEDDPIVKALGTQIQVELNNELQPNTTYTLYFGDAIADNNEGNPYRNFTFSFSTGDEIDSLMMSGIILDARNLDPIKGALIGVYTNMDDTAVTNNVPKRIAQTNTEGIFTIKNLPDSLFHIFGWRDIDKNYRYNPDGEQFAYVDTIYKPYFDTVQVVDTIWVDSLTVDTIMFRDTVVYMPDDIVLLAFKVDKFFQNLKKKSRASKRALLFEFASAVQEMPKIELLDTIAEDWYLMEPSLTRDSLLVWLTDSNVYNMDTLSFSFAYQKTDSLSELVWNTDTLMLNFREKRKVKTKRKNKQKEIEGLVIPVEVEEFEFATNLKGNHDVFRPLEITFTQPVQKFNDDSVHVFEQVNDSTLKKLKVKFVQDDIMPRRYSGKYKWDEEKTYVLQIDSAAFISIYGAVSDNYKKKFAIKGESEFATLILEVKNALGKGYIELLNGNDTPVRTLPFVPGEKVKFRYVEPNTYFARLFIDVNGNGEWDTGNYFEKIQPEPVYYFNQSISLKQNWTLEEEWDLNEFLIHKQKPVSIQNLDKDKK